MKTISTITLLFIVQLVIAQSSFEWAASFGGANIDRSWAVAIDASGNTYSAGDFWGTVDFDPGTGVDNLTSAGSWDGYLQKLNSSGGYEWSIHLGDVAQGVHLDQSGDVFVVGHFSGTFDFDPGPGNTSLTALGTDDGYVAKYTSNGSLAWVKSFQTSALCLAYDLTTTQSGDIYVTGRFNGTCDFDPGLGVNNITAIGNMDVFIVKLNSNGDFIWAKTIGGSGASNYGNSIDVDDTGNPVVCGRFENVTDFDPNAGTQNLTSNGNDDVFILKLDNLGNFDWVAQTGGAALDVGYEVEVNSVGEVYCVGFFEGTSDFDPGVGVLNLNAGTASDGFIWKLNSNGSLDWVKQHSGSGEQVCTSLSLNQNEELIVSGYFVNTVNVDPGATNTSLISSGFNDVSIGKYSESGALLWTNQIEGSNNQVAFGADESNGSICIGGHHTATSDFDIGPGLFELTATGVTDPFVLVLLECIASSPIPNVASLPNITESCSASIQTAPTASNCSGTYTGTPDITFPITTQGTTTITWTYDDGNGNTSSQTQDVIINDVTAPVADVASLSDITAQCEVTSLTAPTATDNCAGSITGTHNASLPITSTITITWTYDDGNGNTSTQIQEVIIDDVTAPVADLASLADVNGQCEVTSLTAPTATDNCAGAITGTHNASLPITSTTTITWTYDDGNGNTSTQTQEVIIDDVSAPVADIASLTDITDECEVTSLTAPTATDNCAGAITGTHGVTLPITSTTTIIWTYDDGNGNTSTQTQEVIIDDVTAPVPDIASLTDITDECEVTSLTAPTATDNCVGAITGTPDVAFPITASGTTTVTWTYDDGNGNTSTQTQDVVITPIDNTVSVVNDITLSADASGYTYQWVDCNDNNAPIAGETNQTFEATANGSYAVIIDNGDCSVTSACNDITTVGLDQNQIETISVFPNPTSGILTIRSSGVFDKIEVMNTLGQVVSNIELNQLDEYQIQLPDAKGVYMVKVSDRDKYEIVRVIKK